MGTRAVEKNAYYRRYVRPSVRAAPIERIFRETWYSERPWKSSEKIQILVKIGQKYGSLMKTYERFIVSGYIKSP